jgi:hypothetical protein
MVRKGYKETELGEIPEEWELQKIGVNISIQGGFAFSSDDYSYNGIKLLKISNVSFGRVIWDDISYLPYRFFDKNKEYSLIEGDLIMAMTRPVVSGGVKVVFYII